ncbi:hypothetical protein EGR_11307 [Echinococcus granulosus]|uniref:Uncharacterized protein n=1 Tax=Echinococcus granulosus TaxID=6210 RepID=W6U676_ECHGR|nr:hypothetical protein EGR_11307 [Echinococcus granulosus]EUB53842.1 hypothetical protein EGR_11307 [Echinococcus granulosus]
MLRGPKTCGCRDFASSYVNRAKVNRIFHCSIEDANC